MILGSIFLVFAYSCGSKEEENIPKKQELMLVVKTIDLADRPVEMVRFYINAKKFGITDQDGIFKGKYPAKNGEVLSFNVEAPEGYSIPANVDQSRWRFKVNYPKDGRPLQVDFTATLQRPERTYLFMVKTETPATPLKVNDNMIGKTGTNGYALFKVPGIPATMFSARAGRVIYKGTFAEDDEVYLLTPEKTGPVGGDQALAMNNDEPPSIDEPYDPPKEPSIPTPIPEPALEPTPPPVPEPIPEPVPEPIPAPPPVVIEEPPVAMPPVIDEPSTPKSKKTPAVVIEPTSPGNPLDNFDPESDSKHRSEKRGRSKTKTEVTTSKKNHRDRDDKPTHSVKVERSTPEPTPVKEEPLDPPIPEIAVVESPDPPPLIVEETPKETETTPAEVKSVSSSPKKSKNSNELDGLVGDDGDLVSNDAKTNNKPITGSTSKVSSMSRQEVSDTVSAIEKDFDRSKILRAPDVEFLSQVDRTNPVFGRANLVLASYYYNLKDYKSQIRSLEAATSRGRLKHDPQILLSLAKAYAQVKNFRKSLSTMQKVEQKMRNLDSAKKADAYRFFAEILEFEFSKQFHDDERKANITLIDKAIQKWEKFKTYNRGTDSSAVSRADAKIRELKELKSRVEL